MMIIESQWLVPWMKNKSLFAPITSLLGVACWVEAMKIVKQGAWVNALHQ
jgi:hypothetical protein